MSGLVLAIDTATPAVTAGVVRRDASEAKVLGARVTLDARLREHAGLAPQAAVIVLGNIDQIEIWDPQAHQLNEVAGQHEIAGGAA